MRTGFHKTEVIIDLDNNSFKGIVGDINEKVKTSINR